MQKLILVLVSGLCLLSACATETIADVPDIDVSEMKKPKLAFLKKREVSLEILDARAPKHHGNSDKLKKRITETLVTYLGASDVKVSDGAPAKLNIYINSGHPVKSEKPGQEFESDDCVSIMGIISQSGRQYCGSTNACYSVVSQGGSHLGSEIGKAYELALENVFNYMDELFEQSKTVKCQWTP